MANAGSIRAGGAYVELLTSPAGLEKGLKQAEARVRSFGNSISGIGKRIGTVGGGIAAPFLGAAKVFADTGSELNDMSERTGVSVEALSALKFAAQQSGTDLGSVEVGLRKMAKALQAGSEENLQAESTFVALGLSVRQLQVLNPEDQFNAIASAIGQIPNPTARAAAAMQVFGKSGTSLLPMIKDLPALTDDAKRLGLVMSTEDAKAADQLGDSIDAAKASLWRVVEVIGAALAPLLTEVAGSIIQVVKTTTTWVAANKPLLVTVFKVGAGIAAAGGALLAIGATITGVSAVFGTLASVLGLVGSALAVLTSPVIVIAAGLGTLAYRFTAVGEAGGEAVAFLKGQFGGLLADAQATFKGIADALKAGDIGLAAQILWAGLKVEFLKGTNYLKGIWADWGVDIANAFRGISFNLARVFVDIGPVLQIAFVTALDGMRDGFTNFVAFLKTSMTSFGGFFAKVWARVKALFTGGDAEAEIDRISKEVESANAATNMAAKETTVGRGVERTGKIADINEGRAAAQQSINDQQDADRAARRKAADAALAGGIAGLEAAKKELADLNSQAAEKAVGVKGLTDTSQEGAGEGLSPEGLDKAIEKTKSKVDVAGSFTAASIAGLGAGESIQNEQLGEAKKQNEKLDKLNKTVERKKAVYS